MDRQQFVGMYDLQETLGKGHFSVVKQAQHVLSKQKVAIKVIEKAKLNALEQEHLHHEVRVMKMINHANIVRLYQVIDTVARLYLILELGSGGDLHEFIIKHGPLSDSIARKYFIQIVNAVQYCHQLRIVHRDLKPENVVFCQNELGQIVVKVCFTVLALFRFSVDLGNRMKTHQECCLPSPRVPRPLVPHAYLSLSLSFSLSREGHHG
jgi:serine/threonine protein kinase